MSNQEAEPTDTEDVPDIELADPDDYHRRQRLKEIHKARQRVHNAMSNMDDTPDPKEAENQRRQLAFAVSMYVSELEPVIRDTNADVSLPERYPWDTALQFADALGMIPEDCEPTSATYSPKPNTVEVFRICNRVLANVKPLIEEDDNDEWEV
jgi:hypothetical protein